MGASSCRAALGWTAEGGCPYVIRVRPPGLSKTGIDKGGDT